MSRVSWALILAALTAVAQQSPVSRDVDPEDRTREAALGAKLAEDIRKHHRLLDSAVVRRYVEKIAAAVTAQLPADSRDYRLEILAEPGSGLREPQVLPGGYIFVPAGLFLAAENESEFAGILAHSLAHSAARHSARVLTRPQPTAFEGARQTVRTFAPIHSREGTLPIAMTQQLRELELEADRLAVAWMAGAGYDPEALAQYIARTQPAVAERPTAFSPLPPRDKRLAALREAIAALPPREYPGDSGEFAQVQAEVRAILERARPAPSLRRP